jgi:hypothetical protein
MEKKSLQIMFLLRLENILNKQVPISIVEIGIFYIMVNSNNNGGD